MDFIKEYSLHWQLDLIRRAKVALDGLCGSFQPISTQQRMNLLKSVTSFFIEVFGQIICTYIHMEQGWCRHFLKKLANRKSANKKPVETVKQ